MTSILVPPLVRSSKYLHPISTPESLLTAWLQVRNNAAARGELPKSIETFAKSAFDQIEELSRQLRTGTLEPHQLTPVRIKKPHGGVRQLHLPSVRDRVVERAIINEISPVVDMKMSPMSFAYRAGTTTAHAAQTLRELGTEGVGHVFLTDITDCFGSINMEAAIAFLDSWVNDAGLASLLRQLARRSVRGQNGAFSGLPQGAPLSPLLSNVYLTQFDNAVSNRGIAMVRYADDIAALVTPDSPMRDAEQIIEEEANRLSLRLSREKTDRMAFRSGFTFLGHEIVEAEEPSHSRPPERQTVYVARPDAIVRIKKGRLIVAAKDECLLSIPQSRVERIVTFGPVSVSAGVRQWALYSGVDWACLSARGSYLGAVVSHRNDSVRRRSRQFKFSTSPFANSMAGRFVHGKMSNSLALLRRYSHRVDSGLIARMAGLVEHASGALDNAKSHTSIMGLEGAVAASYWSAFQSALPSDLGFVGRRRRPPPDAVNAALSYAYTILASEGAGALAAAGLDPAIGLLHRNHDGRASLALDLIEEFRPIVVDTVVLELARRGMLGPHAIAVKSGEARFTAAGRVMFLQRYERRMTTGFFYTPGGYRCSYRRALHLQAQSVARCVDTGEATYRAVTWRL